MQSVFDLQFSKNIRSIKKKVNTNSTRIEDQEEEPEDIAANDYVALANQAESQGNYRLAYRFLFLDILQRLDVKKYIEWQKNKTNLDYIKEITNETVKKEYQSLANYFNYIWYGEKPIDVHQFETGKNEIQSLKQSL